MELERGQTGAGRKEDRAGMGFEQWSGSPSLVLRKPIGNRENADEGSCELPLGRALAVDGERDQEEW